MRSWNNKEMIVTMSTMSAYSRKLYRHVTANTKGEKRDRQTEREREMIMSEYPASTTASGVPSSASSPSAYPIKPFRRKENPQVETRSSHTFTHNHTQSHTHTHSHTITHIHIPTVTHLLLDNDAVEEDRQQEGETHWEHENGEERGRI